MTEAHARWRAEEFRREHNLGHQPLGDLVALIEQTTGCDVAIIDTENDEHGLTMQDPHRDVVFIAVATTAHPTRQRSSLAHELGHVVFQDWEAGPLSSQRTKAEVRADTFARHLLLPQAGLTALLGQTDSADEADLSAVVQRFLVSPTIAAIAMKQAGYISEGIKESWRLLTTRALAARHGWTDQYLALSQDSRQRRAPQHLVARAIQGYLANTVSAQTIATLRGLDVGSIMSELNEAGIKPPQDVEVIWARAAALGDEVNVDLGDLDDLPGPDLEDENSAFTGGPAG